MSAIQWFGAALWAVVFAFLAWAHSPLNAGQRWTIAGMVLFAALLVFLAGQP